MGVFTTTKRRKKSIAAQIKKELRLAAQNDLKKKLAALRKARRGY